MPINKINSILPSFKRVVRVNSQGSSSTTSNSRNLDRQTLELYSLLNGQNSRFYTKKQKEKIKDFFETTLGDYNGKDGIMILRLDNKDTVLISGQDTKDILSLEKKLKRERRQIEITGNESKAAKEAKIQDTHIKFEKEIKSRLENGTLGKPKTTYDISCSNKSKNKDLPFNIFVYTSIAESYAVTEDGAWKKDAMERDFPIGKARLLHATFEQKRIFI